MRMPLRLRATPQTKYRAKRCMIEGIPFHSQKEGARYIDLRRLEKAGYVRNLELQPRFELVVHAPDGSDQVIGRMTLDFKYEERQPGTDWQWRYEDVKSPATRTTAYRLRKKMVEAIYGIAVLET